MDPVNLNHSTRKSRSHPSRVSHQPPPSSRPQVAEGGQGSEQEKEGEAVGADAATAEEVEKERKRGAGAQTRASWGRGRRHGARRRRRRRGARRRQRGAVQGEESARKSPAQVESWVGEDWQSRKERWGRGMEG
ncbi:hypothetical protein OsI_33839 [Oryza sativa Indica Group]|uniref:Uncharacterized protein n=1 Tax=Oryza sativa subsp. indica TaxID=39946 RepID=A2Z800_ORYSI|nr:hypothetical protein OsI_33839 [Oryza sativa Indica Group]